MISILKHGLNVPFDPRPIILMPNARCPTFQAPETQISIHSHCTHPDSANTGYLPATSQSQLHPPFPPSELELPHLRFFDSASGLGVGLGVGGAVLVIC
jgi:hypothetical protein